MKFSIIIPVYNSEKYLKECVDSVLGQTHDDLEVILVDDESNDSSPKICKDYSLKDSRVKYIRKRNGGTSSARNVGLDNATGDYLMFIDNDDVWMDINAVSDINCLLQESNADVLMFDTAVYDQKSDKLDYKANNIDRSKLIGQSAADALRTIMSNGVMSRAVWSRVIRRDVVEKSHIRFPEGMRNEDTAFSAELIINSKSYDWYNNVFYKYRVNTGDSQTSKPINKDQLDDLKRILYRFANAGKKMDEDMREALYSYLAFPYAVWIGYSMVSDETSKMEIKEMKKISYLLRYDEDSSVKTLSKAYRILGYKGVCLLLKFWVKKNR